MPPLTLVQRTINRMTLGKPDDLSPQERAELDALEKSETAKLVAYLEGKKRFSELRLPHELIGRGYRYTAYQIVDCLDGTGLTNKQVEDVLEYRKKLLTYDYDQRHYWITSDHEINVRDSKGTYSYYNHGRIIDHEKWMKQYSGFVDAEEARRQASNNKGNKL